MGFSGWRGEVGGEASLVPAFFSMFCLIYLAGYFGVFRRWSPAHRPDATSCFISLFHGTPAALLAAAALRRRPWGFAAPNTPLQALALDFSIAYFALDLLHYLLLAPADPLFVAHHLATLFVLATCRHVAAHGASAVLALLLLAEATSACQNAWTLAALRRADHPAADRAYRLLSAPFYTLYTLMRVVFGPAFFIKMSAFYLGGGGDDAIPRWVALSWVVVVGTAIATSIFWISNLWAAWFRERAQSQSTEEKKKGR